MGLIVQKFGGTSVANIDRIKAITDIIKATLDQGNKVIVIVSAMAGVTNHLVTLCNNLSNLNDQESLIEYDVALSSGEMVTSALLAISLQSNNIKAKSLLAWQIPILTDDNYSNAKVQSINTDLIKQYLNQGITPVIAGFQGITNDKYCTTLGRGGSDTSASLIAAAMCADMCDIYTDVDGVFSADPRIINNAKHLKEVDFEEMLVMSSAGAKVLHPRCVEIAMRYNIPIRVLSSFENNSQGSIIKNRRDIMEKPDITSITIDKDLMKLTINNISGIYKQKLLSEFISNGIQIILMLHAYNECVFIIKLTNHAKLRAILNNLKIDYQLDNNIAAVSIIGYGLKNDSKIISSMISEISNNEIEIFAVDWSSIKVSLFISEQYAEKVMRVCYALGFKE